MNDMIFSSAFIAYLLILAGGCSALILYGVDFLKDSLLPEKWYGGKKTLIWVFIVTAAYTFAAWTLHLFNPIYDKFPEYTHATIIAWFFIITLGTACGINNRQKKIASYAAFGPPLPLIQMKAEPIRYGSNPLDFDEDAIRYTKTTNPVRENNNDSK